MALSLNPEKEIATTLGKEEAFCQRVCENMSDHFIKAKNRTQGKHVDPGGNKVVPFVCTPAGVLDHTAMEYTLRIKA